MLVRPKSSSPVAPAREHADLSANLIMHPRDNFGIKRAVISFLAGDVYDSGPVRRRMLAFRAIYYFSAMLDWRRALRAVFNRRNAVQPQTIYATDGSG